MRYYQYWEKRTIYNKIKIQIRTLILYVYIISYKNHLKLNFQHNIKHRKLDINFKLHITTYHLILNISFSLKLRHLKQS
jgi:hypothetical protein